MGFDMNKTKFFIVLSLFFFILSCILAVKLSNTEENLVKVIKDNVEESLETTENVGIEITTSEDTLPVTVTETIEIEIEIETTIFETKTEEVNIAAMVVESPTEEVVTTDEKIYIPTEEVEEIVTESSTVFLETTEPTIEVETTEEPAANVSWEFSEEEIDMIANVVMHEVGGFYGTELTINATYADGRDEVYSSPNLIFRFHAQVLINQYNSAIFPNSLSSCIKNYWAKYLANPNYYNHNNLTWQYCRQQVLYVLENGCELPTNVFGATCDPYFDSRYNRYSQYAKVYWETDWKYGTFYYYEYN